MADAANRAADDRPSAAGCQPPLPFKTSAFTEISATPAIATPIASSIRAVAAIWVEAPTRVQSAMPALMAGRLLPVQASVAPRNRIAKGKPNRKLTRVAPSAPSRGVSSRCMALRAGLARCAGDGEDDPQEGDDGGHALSRTGIMPGRRCAMPFRK